MAKQPSSPALTFFEPDDDGQIVVAHRHRRDVFPADREPGIVARIQHRMPGEHEVARVVGGAVRPLHPLAEMQDDRLAVFADTAVLRGRHLRDGRRNEVAVGVVAEERLENDVGDVVRRLRVREERVERVRLVRGPVAQCPGLRPRVSPREVRRSATDLRARTEHDARGGQQRELTDHPGAPCFSCSDGAIAA